MLDQHLEQQIFVAGQLERLTAVDDARFQRAHLEAFAAHWRRRGQPAQHHADTRYQFARRERLGHVIVDANFKADNAVDLVAAGGEENDGHVGELAQAAAHFKAVGVGQADVEHDQGRRLGARGPHDVERFFAQARVQRREAVGAQRVGDALGDGQFVFDNQDRPRHAQASSEEPSIRAPRSPVNPLGAKRRRLYSMQCCRGIFCDVFNGCSRPP